MVCGEGVSGVSVRTLGCGCVVIFGAPMICCRQADAWLDALESGELDAEERQRVENELNRHITEWPETKGD